ncbi:hypothetical protein D9611_012862 [Ephemerocybe angulata]|uniref:Uncharacterized protein n=1 Tax=Ephemerocybe angulata TaxID=980116 RepID=A0A8H5F125_9AGAR|nr:hypothetical protein D9611_012862 [Tulosesus angulatus]
MSGLKTKFASFPEVLVVHAKKFQLVNWVSAKVDPIILPPDNLLEFTEKHLGTGLKLVVHIDEPIVAKASTVGRAEPSAEAEGMLADRGFTTAQARRALKETLNGSSATQTVQAKTRAPLQKKVQEPRARRRSYPRVTWLDVCAGEVEMTIEAPTTTMSVQALKRVRDIVTRSATHVLRTSYASSHAASMTHVFDYAETTYAQVSSRR